jgi:hypothetical protein
MCTATVLRRSDRVLLTMNRDERRDRAAELQPRLNEDGRLGWIGPADGERGGTWIGANAAGVAACLLNGYAPGDLELFGRPDVPSRGFIIPELLRHDADAAREWLADGIDPAPYPSFTLVVLTPAWGQLLRWRLDDGLSRRRLDEGWSLVTSSFWRTEEVEAWRHQEFLRWLEDGGDCRHGLPSFNLLEAPGRREWSPFMTRPLSITRSITQLEISSGEEPIRLRYWRRDGEADVDPAFPTATLELESAVGAGR